MSTFRNTSDGPIGFDLGSKRYSCDAGGCVEIPAPLVSIALARGLPLEACEARKDARRGLRIVPPPPPRLPPGIEVGTLSRAEYEAYGERSDPPPFGGGIAIGGDGLDYLDDDLQDAANDAEDAHPDAQEGAAAVAAAVDDLAERGVTINASAERRATLERLRKK